MIRTVSGVIEELRKEDPDTPISRHALMSWIKSGVLPSVKSGNKYLLDMEVVRKFLAGGAYDGKKED